MRGPSIRLAAIAVAVAVLGAADALANGFGGSESPPARIPLPAHDYRAIVEDQSGTRVEVTQVTFNGEVFLYGTFGEGQVTVPFDTIQIARIEPTDTDGKRIAFVTLKDGSSVRMTVEADQPTYGRTVFGTYSIPIEKVRQIEFLGDTAPAPVPAP
jgi:hypothetical protein